MIYLCFILALCFDMLWNLPTSAQLFLSLCSILTLIGLLIADVIKKRVHLERNIVFLCMILWILLYELCKQNEYFYSLLMMISSSFASLIGALIQNPISMGITYSGMDLVILFFTLGLTHFLLFRPKNAIEAYHSHPKISKAALLFHLRTIKKILLYLVACIIIWGVYIALWTVLAQNSLLLRLNLLEPLTGALDYRILLFGMLAITFRFFETACLKQKEFRIRGNKNFLSGDKKIASMINLLLIFMLIGIYLTFTMTDSIVDNKFFDSGATSNVSNKKSPNESETSPILNKTSQHKDIRSQQILFWDTGLDFELPVYGRYGLDDVGMFGVLIRYLQTRGNQCLIEKELDISKLDEMDILCIINPMRGLTYDEISEIYQFVENGGITILAGDHTGEEQIRQPINSILERVDISLNFDSAIPFKSLWGGKYEKRGELTKHIDDSQVQMVVGASLQIPPNAKPLICVKEGYSDRGDMQNRKDGYLGDMRFFAGERIGDLVLAAQLNYGDGKFLVFGDTSLFQNTVLPYSHTFIDAIFQQNSDYAQGSFDKIQGEVYHCVINSNHLESIYRDKSKDSIDGFLTNLLRADFLPLINLSSSISELCENKEELKLIVLIEPALDFSRKEIRSLENFMRRGGNLIVCADYKSPRASKNLVGHFGFSFEKIPIGRISPDKDPDMAFWDACPILYEGLGLQTYQTQDVKSLMSIWDYSVIAQKNIGDGAFYLISDGSFLKNKNLEDIKEYREGNIDFIKNLLEEIKKRR